MSCRREFLKHTLNAGVAITAGTVAKRTYAARQRGSTEKPPNILWLTCEDIGPELGCYGDTYADTPKLDALAAKGMIYENFWSAAPVCAPARTTIISGIYPPSTGSEHMRSLTRLPAGFKMFPQYLREHGYYCTNNSKEDYNLEKPGQVWDESSRTAHWKNRNPDQPFFAVFNNTVTHESRIRVRPHEWIHDLAKAPIPAYHPDTAEVREDWAQYYDNITTMDKWAGERMDELEAAGLADDTIVFFYGDQGSGMPRSKRWPYNSGLRVALIAYIPPKYRHLAPKDYRAGAKTDRLAGFIDLAPTTLSLAGIKPPAEFQGYAFMGEYEAKEQPYSFGFRGRMDERYDMVRTVRDKRYQYIRNYMPHKIYGQYIAYMFKTPTTRIWKELYDQGKLNAAQSHFWETKPPEELYDLDADPDEVNNLAGSAKYKPVLEKMRHALLDWERRIRDVGFLPEDEIHTRSANSSPYEVGHDDKQYPLDRIMDMAGAASSLDDAAIPKLLKGISDKDSAVRYWAAMGLLMRGKKGISAGGDALRRAISTDPSLNVRIVAAESLGRYGTASDLKIALDTLRNLAEPKKNRYFVVVLALNAIDSLGKKAAPLGDFISTVSYDNVWDIKRGGGYTNNLQAHILTNLGRPVPAKKTAKKPRRGKRAKK
ncbi:MAG: sulfatase-like hydrolase/transferase [Candidatus Hydrogenedentes bacterium]|nr:sulfatase-like hydrolase/transferase [Candidatus Hydrogenedentota bacterium]